MTIDALLAIALSVGIPFLLASGGGFFGDKSFAKC